MSIVNGDWCRISGSGPSRLSLAQSTASRTRSPAQSGTVRFSSSRGMNAYSPGSGAWPARYMYAALPSCRSASVAASSEPSASPSGFSCVVTRKRSCERSASTTASRSAFWFVVVCDELIDQLRHANALFDRRIVLERHLRRALQPQLARDPPLQHPVRGLEPDHRLLALARGAEDADEDGRLPKIGRRVDTGDRDEADARILQLADGLSEHLAQGFVHAPHPASHRSSPPGVRRSSIRSPARASTAQRRRATPRRRRSPARRRRRSAARAARARDGRLLRPTRRTA